MQTIPLFESGGALEQLRVLFIGGYWMGTGDVVHLYLDGLRDLGVQVLEYCTDEHMDALDYGERPYDRGTFGPVYLRWEALEPVIQRQDPHLIVCCAGGLAFRPEIADQLRRRCCLIGMAMSEPDVFEPATSQISASFDHFFTNHRGTVERHRRLGARCHWLPYPCYPRLHYRRPPDPRFACDVLIAAQGREDRTGLVRLLDREFRVKVFGSQWKPFGVEAVEVNLAQEGLAAVAFSSATVSFDFARNFAGIPIVKLRLFEISGSGGIACAEFSEDLPFVFNEEEVLSFSNEQEMLAKLHRAVADPDWARSVRKNAYWRAHSEHTVEHRWLAVFQQCGLVRSQAP